MVALVPVDGTYGIARLEPSSPLPDWAAGTGLVSVTRTSEELSIVCHDDRIPDRVTAERGWRTLRVAGTLELTQTGILNSLTAPLSERGISVFAVSTYDTDYLLVPEGSYLATIECLTEAGHDILDTGRDARTDDDRS